MKLKMFKYNFEDQLINNFEIENKAVSLMSWPVVYLLVGESYLYVGQSTNFKNRIKTHDKEKRESFDLKRYYIFTFDQSNLSLCLQLESDLITNLSCDLALREKKHNIELINGNGGSSHNYFGFENGKQALELIWEELKTEKIALVDLKDIADSQLFKYSPYKSFDENQLEIINYFKSFIIEDKESENQETFNYNFTSIIPTPNSQLMLADSQPAPLLKRMLAVKGGPGTGKTLVMVKMVYDLIWEKSESNEIDKSKRITTLSPEDIELIIQSDGDNIVTVLNQLCKNIQYRNEKGELTQFRIKTIRTGQAINSIVGKQIKKKYMFIDEGQALKSKEFRSDAQELSNMENGKTLIDYLPYATENLVLFYDQNQMGRTAETNVAAAIKKLVNEFGPEIIRERELEVSYRQLQVWLDFAQSFINRKLIEIDANKLGMDIKIFDTVREMHAAIKEKNKVCGLSRMMSTFYRGWISSKDNSQFDFTFPDKEGDYNLQWRPSNVKVLKDECVDYVSYFHDVRGKDMFYGGVIIGDDIFYNKETGEIDVNINNNKDPKIGLPSKSTVNKNYQYNKEKDINTKKRNILNQLYILLTRASEGVYLYIEDEALKEHIKEKLNIK